MKTILLATVLFIAPVVLALGQTAPTTDLQTTSLAKTNPLNNPELLRQMQEAAQAAADAAYQAKRYTNVTDQLASMQDNIIWGNRSIGHLQIEGSSAVGGEGPNAVRFAARPDAAGAVDFTMAGGQHLQSHVMGLAYYTADGRSVLIAGVTNSQGEVIEPNQVLYPDAFDTARADILYTYTPYSMEQDIVIRRKLPDLPPEFDPGQTYLAVLTEFENPPDPIEVPESVDLRPYAAAVGASAAGRLTDNQLYFRHARIVKGRAFLIGDSKSEAPTIKMWQKIEGRTFLVELTPYALIKKSLDALPPDTGMITPDKPEKLFALLKRLPTGQTHGESSGTFRLAQASPLREPGVVLDYLIINNPLLDVNVGGSDTNKVGPAAIGQTTNDYWNGYTAAGGSATNVTVYDLRWADRNRSGINMTIQNAPGAWGNTTGDGMYDTFRYPWNGGNVTATLNNVPAGNYDFYLYGHSNSAYDNTKFHITVGGTSTPVKQTEASYYAATSTNWQEGVQYVSFTNISVSAGQSVTIVGAPGSGVAILNGIQMVANGSGSPVVLSQPAGVTAFEGTSASFAVTASGTLPLYYQWKHNGTNLAGATAATLTLNDVQLEDGGKYSAIVSNSLGTVTSSEAVLTVLNSGSSLLDIDLNGYYTNVGFGAAGVATNDFWNRCFPDGAIQGPQTVSALKWSDGYTSPVSVTVSNAPGRWGNTTENAMYNSFIYPWNGGSVITILSNLASGTYDFYLYGHSNSSYDNSSFQISTGVTNTGSKLTQDSTFAATSADWVEGVQYVAFRGVAVTNTSPVVITCARGDGTAIFNGLQILLPNPPASLDSNGDGIPDWWCGHYGFNPHDQTVATNDLDGDGVDNLDEYLNGTDPNEIQAQIHFENLWATNTAWPGTIEIDAGQPEYMAVLVNDTNFPAASWNSYSSNFTANLGTTDGVYVVSVGLRGHADDSVQTWISTRIRLDRVPPWLVITNPVPRGVSRPMIQLQGYCGEPLTSLYLDVSNATGLSTNLEGFVLSQTYDTNQNVVTTNIFQCFDVDLTNGVNAITLRAADMAGNTTITNFNYTLASDSTAPIITLRNPTSGMKLCGDTFSMDGWLDDFTATVTASVVDGSGATNVYDAVVERDGRFWLDDMALGSGTSVVTLTARDFWGNSVSTNISITKSTVQLTVDPIDAGTLAGPVTTVSGTVDSGYTVWVNGIQATDEGGGYWQADEVPVTTGGTAVFDVTAYPSGEAPDSQLQGQGVNPSTPNAQNLTTDVDQPDRLYVSLASQHLYDDYNEIDTQEVSGGSCGHALYIVHSTEIHDLDWAGGDGATGTAHYVDENTTEDGSYNQTEDDSMMWPEDQNGWLDWGLVDETSSYWDTYGNPGYTNTFGPYLIEPPLVAWEHCNVTDPSDSDESGSGTCGAYHDVRHEDYERCAATFLSYFTGGKAVPHKQNVIEFNGWAEHLLVRRDQPQDPGLYHDSLQVEVPPTKVAIGGQGYLGSDHLLYKVLPDGATVDVTPTVSGDDFYYFDLGPTKYTQVHLTKHEALTNTNRDRTTIGVAEEVDFSGMPSQTIWSATAGGLSATNGSGMTFTAPSNAANVTVTAKVRTASINTAFNVEEPIGLDHATNKDVLSYPKGQNAAGMENYVWIAPTSVSFYRVEIIEVPGPATGVSGYWANTNIWSPTGNLAHHPAGWVSLSEDNKWGGYDVAADPGNPAPWSDGTFQWDIPVGWRVIGTTPTNYMSG